MGRNQKVQTMLQEAGLHSPLVVGLGQPQGAELSADLGWSSNPEPAGGCVTLGKSLPIWAHSLCLCEIHLPSLSLCEVSLSSFLSICSTLPVPGGMDRANSRSALKCPWA